MKNLNAKIVQKKSDLSNHSDGPLRCSYCDAPLTPETCAVYSEALATRHDPDWINVLICSSCESTVAALPAHARDRVELDAIATEFRRRALHRAKALPRNARRKVERDLERNTQQFLRSVIANAPAGRLDSLKGTRQ